MKYRAEWDSLTCRLEVFEDDKCILTDRTESAWAASEAVREAGYAFRDMWTRGPGDGDIFKAQLKAVESQES